MAFYDWNHDGKKDFADDYLEYNIYKESTKNSGSTASSGGFLGKLFIVFIVFIVFYIFIYLFGDLFETERPCMAIGCREDRLGSSIYCIELRRECE